MLKVSLSVGEMSEAIEDALRFAFEALTEQRSTRARGAELDVTMVRPRSRCLECGAEYGTTASICCVPNARASRRAPRRREMQIDSIEWTIQMTRQANRKDQQHADER